MALSYILRCAKAQLSYITGFRNTSSQIAAAFTPDGKYVVCGSEDSHVYVWQREEPRNGKTKPIINTSSYEYFQCKDVSVAIPWPGSVKFEPPTIQLHSKKNFKKPAASATSSPRKEDLNKNNKRLLPPLPNNKKNNNATDKTVSNNINNTNSSSSSNENPNNSNINKDYHDKNNSSNNSENSVDGERAPDSPEADPAQITRTESGMGSSFSSCSGGSIRYGDSPSISSNQSSSSHSWAPGWSWFDGGGSHGSDTMQARAWGLVIVTAGLGGEIRAYQNIGVPLKVGRQSNLFLT